MYRGYSLFAWLMIGSLSLYCVAQDISDAQFRNEKSSRRPLTVADTIEMTTIAQPGYRTSLAQNTTVGQFSPDGSYFAIVLQKGNLARNIIEYSLLVFRSADLLRSSPAPRMTMARFASSSNRPAISHVKWLGDNEHIVFLGEEPGEQPQLYRANCKTKVITKLTNQATGVLAYATNDKADTIVFVAGAKKDSLRSITDDMLQGGFIVTSQRWDDLYGAGQPKVTDFRKEVFVKTPRLAKPQQVGGVLFIPDDREYSQAISLSPNGKYALITSINTSPPPIWRYYDGTFSGDTTVACSTTDAYLCPEEYLLLDLQKRSLEPLINAPVTQPNGGKELFAWTSRNSVVLVNTFLPPDVPHQEGGQDALYIAEIAIPDRNIQEIAMSKTPWHGYAIHQGIDSDQFVIDPIIDVYGPALQLWWHSGKWHITAITSAPKTERFKISITLDEGLNIPPTLVAYDERRKRKSVLMRLNPQFDTLTFGRVEAFQWTTPSGYKLEGALYLPPDFVPGKRYPLVIQTHAYNRKRFWPDGPYTTAYAAQPLANRGFIVLQIPVINPYADSEMIKNATKVFDTDAEGPYAMEVFDSAIEQLDHLGLIDPTRIALTGFSRTVYHVLYTLTHSQHKFAAAVVADGVNFGYADCIYYLAKTDHTLCEKMNGGRPPYGDGLVGWARDAPTFRLDKIDAPLLLQAITAPIGEWEILAGLRWLKKPVEMVNFFPEGTHELVKPRQRLLSEQSVVDWYCFWLKNEEDPDQMKATQYARWRQMKQESKQKPSE